MGYTVPLRINLTHSNISDPLTLIFKVAVNRMTMGFVYLVPQVKSSLLFSQERAEQMNMSSQIHQRMSHMFLPQTGESNRGQGITAPGNCRSQVGRCIGRGLIKLDVGMDELKTKLWSQSPQGSQAL